MRIARLRLEQPTWVAADGDAWRPIEDPFAAFGRGEQPAFLGGAVDGAVLAPCDPRVVVGIAQNGREAPLPVQAWLKSPRSVVASGERVALRRNAGKQVAEAEIAVVIGRDAVAVREEDAASVILGVTAVNDLSSPDRAVLDERNFEAKGGVGYTPLGPWVDTDADIAALRYSLSVDGSVVAETESSALPASIAACVAYVTSWVPLGPGDIIMTGAPHSNAEVLAGQTIEVRVGDMVLVTPTE